MILFALESCKILSDLVGDMMSSSVKRQPTIGLYGSRLYIEHNFNYYYKILRSNPKEVKCITSHYM